jgi:hypothetical protein
MDAKDPQNAPKTGLYVVWAGTALLALGYLLLGRGSMTAAPVLIIGAFIVVGTGIAIGWE